ncbi:hypothetical protein ABZ883_36585 [Streptomyces sp. NPDC046977]
MDVVTGLDRSSSSFSLCRYIHTATQMRATNATCHQDGRNSGRPGPLLF